MSQVPAPSRQPTFRRIVAKCGDILPEIAAKQAGVWLFALISFAGVWLWGWMVGGGLTRIIGAVPRGAVIAFSAPCPADWKEYSQAAGRFVIGANLDQRNGLKNRLPADPPGGNETVALKPEHLPPHVHHGKTTGTEGKTQTLQAGDVRNQYDFPAIVGRNDR
jgi:hypothetical protein